MRIPMMLEHNKNKQYDRKQKGVHKTSCGGHVNEKPRRGERPLENTS